MRFLFIDSNYPAFLDGIYRDRPGLESAPYEEQRAVIRNGMFGEAEFQAQALRGLGHEAEVVVVNAFSAQRAWAQEHEVPGLTRDHWSLRLRRGLVPWPVRPRAGIKWELLLAQIRDYRPDVLYVGIIGSVPAPVARRMKTMVRLLVAQVATELAPGLDFRAYDLIVSALPSLVDRFRGDGLSSERLPLAFGPEALAAVQATDRDVPVSFVGSFSYLHSGRREMLEAVARTSPLQVWTGDLKGLGPESPLQGRLAGSAWGRGMYEVLARSRITLNHHAPVAGPYAVNLRLYEATGMGALLVTDAKSDLGELFDVGSELVAYASPEECAELVSYYCSKPDEASRIAAAGQQRTLRDHTWNHRMERLMAMVESRL
jgi:spore maturation protein CgeB